MSNYARSARPRRRQALGVRPFSWPCDDALDAAGRDSGARFFVRFAMAGITAFTGRRVRNCVNRAKVGAAGTPMTCAGLRGRQRERHLSARLWVAVVRALHVA